MKTTAASHRVLQFRSSIVLDHPIQISLESGYLDLVILLRSIVGRHMETTYTAAVQ
jgi:hypothetical protein